MARSASAQRPRRATSVPPCTMANRAWSGRRWACRQRSAQRMVRSTAALKLAGVAVAGRAFIEAHGDVGAEILLNLHRFFRGQLQQAAVDVRAKHGRAIVDLEVGGQAEDLVAAAVGEDGPAPAHEAVQPAELGDDLVAGPQREMVGVAEHDLHADLFELGRRQTLDGGLRADGHERGRLDGAMAGVQAAAAGAGVGGEKIEMKRHGFLLCPLTTFSFPAAVYSLCQRCSTKSNEAQGQRSLSLCIPCASVIPCLLAAQLVKNLRTAGRSADWAGSGSWRRWRTAGRCCREPACSDRCRGRDRSWRTPRRCETGFVATAMPS